MLGATRGFRLSSFRASARTQSLRALHSRADPERGTHVEALHPGSAGSSVSEQAASSREGVARARSRVPAARTVQAELRLRYLGARRESGEHRVSEEHEWI